jgi:hypothetical protein
MSLIQEIKEASHKVTEDFMLHNTSPNDTIEEMIKNGSIENEEILKRVCETSNQSIYLSLFNSPDTNNENIVFDYADFEKLSSAIKTRENHMNDYNTAPKDFRNSLAFIIQPSEEVKVASEFDNLKEIKKVANDLNKLTLFRNSLETLKAEEVKTAEQAYSVIADQTKEMVVNGDSIGDISKIASRHVKDAGLDFTKVAKAYDIIHDDIKKSGFDVDTSFSKISSQKINTEAEMLYPVEEFTISIEKVAACEEMINNIDNHIKAYKKVLDNA